MSAAKEWRETEVDGPRLAKMSAAKEWRETEVGGPQALISIRRLTQLLGCGVPFRVQLDGRKVATLWIGQSVDIRASPGEHTLVVSSGLILRGVLTVELSPTERLEVVARSQKSFLDAMIAGFTRPRSALILEVGLEAGT